MANTSFFKMSLRSSLTCWQFNPTVWHLPLPCLYQLYIWVNTHHGLDANIQNNASLIKFNNMVLKKVFLKKIICFLKIKKKNLTNLIFCYWFFSAIDFNLYSRNTMVGDYINIIKTICLFQFWLLTSFFRITSLQVIKEKLFNWQLLLTNMFMCIHAV